VRRASIGVCVAFALGLFTTAGAVAAGDANLVLTIERPQDLADIDLSRPPLWRALSKCGAASDDIDCLLERMTASPSEVPASWIVASALNLARYFDGRLRSESNGADDLRAAQAYLVAAVYEARDGAPARARTDFQTALARANGAERSQYLVSAQLVSVYATRALGALGGN
jgi:hypothetical protein